MSIFEALILGIIQGLAEFLPISSSGHLVMFQRLFGVNEGNLTFSIAVHLATLIAVIFVFWKDIVDILRKPFGKLPVLIVIGSIPTAAIAFMFKDFFEGIYATGASLGFGFILTGLILWYAEGVKGKGKSVDKMTPVDAIIIGTAQGMAILPAVSRSGFTISGALFRGLDRELALKFSFIMSIPAILGAALVDILGMVKSNEGMVAAMGVDFWPLVVGMVAAAISGYFAIKFMVNVLLKGSLKIFSYYVFILGALVLIDQLFFGKFFMKLI